ncbi:MAG: hypothetical protein M1823_000496 [Watsoniomyces obsoletus]|nr:MAG: hypothetical protein M1823_000496 [Watsoniomyces obsoletus]
MPPVKCFPPRFQPRAAILSVQTPIQHDPFGRKKTFDNGSQQTGQPTQQHRSPFPGYRRPLLPAVSYKPVASPSLPPPTEKKLSLLDELFPRDAWSLSNRPTDRHRERLPLPDVLGPAPESPENTDLHQGRKYHSVPLIEQYVRASQARVRNILKEQKERNGERASIDINAPLFKEELLEKEELTVLILYNASPSLTDHDIRRIVPRGKHIREWRGAGNIEKVIPGRDPDTLAPLGFYYLLFKSARSARAYQTEVSRLHALALKQTPQTTEGPIAVPPGFKIDGEDIHQALQSYTLIPPSQSLVMKLASKPFSSSVQRIIDAGGYSKFTTLEAASSAHAVLLHIDGFQPRTKTLRKFFTSQKIGFLEAKWDFIDTEEALVEIERLPGLDAEDTLSRPSIDDGGGVLVDDDGGRKDTAAATLESYTVRKWIAFFKTPAAASRFVRNWHKKEYIPRRSNSNWTDGNGYQDQFESTPAIINAELLW